MVSVAVFGVSAFYLSGIILQAVLGLDVGAFDKLQYYASGNTDAANFSAEMMVLPFIWVCLLVVGSAMIQLFQNLVLAMAFLYVCLLSFPLLSFRLTLLASAALMGLMLYLLLARLKPSPFLWVYLLSLSAPINFGVGLFMIL